MRAQALIVFTAAACTERFIVRLPDVGLTVLVEHNLSIAPRVPAPSESRSWSEPGRSHEGGYIMYGGRRYD